MARTPLPVTSLQNERVKLIRSLEMRKARRETGLFVAEGASLIVSARDNGFTPRILVSLMGAPLSPIQRGLVDWALEAGSDVLDVGSAVLAKLASKDNPQTLMAVFEQRFVPPPEAANMSAGDLWVVLEEIRDPGNLGTIIRTADAVGAKGVVLVGQCCDPYSHECVRATMGSVFAVPIARMDKAGFVEWAGTWPGEIIGTHLDGSEDFRAVRLSSPALLVMGAEGPGMSEEVKARCSRLVRIPMAGQLDSLNLAVATALTLYQLRGDHLTM